MSETVTAEDYKKTVIAAMGRELGELYCALRDRHISACEAWNEYVALYGKSPQRLEVLNSAAPHTFYVIQRSLWADVILYIARTTDPPTTAGKPNLTVRRISDLVCEPALRTEIQDLVATCLSTAEFARDWRNRMLAHTDLELSTTDTAQPLALASKAQVDIALGSVSKLLNRVSQQFQDSETAYGHASVIGTAIGLVHVLKDGLDAQTERRERMAKGIAHPDDFRTTDL